ncbi:MAG TPA: hypothetical protein PKY89_01780 [Deltaproteobacteria bacterium]|nr:hypothetical protein [Deltaproteobacteria bacterium]
MDDKPRLGRGLEEVSQFYLTSGRRDEPGRQIKAIKTHPIRSPIKIFHPGSSLMQSCFLANFALELARNRLHVFIWDCLDRHENSTCALMKDLIPSYRDAAAATASLYGLPDIVIYKQSSHTDDTPAGLVTTLSTLEEEGCLLVNTPGSLTAVLPDDLSADCIVLTRTDEHALLQCYAYIKVILKNTSPGDIFLIFDDPGGDEETEELFSRFARFIEQKLNFPLHYLGSLRHDRYLEQSVEESRPLMLFQEPSEAKEDLASISRSYLLSRQAKQGG